MKNAGFMSGGFSYSPAAYDKSQRRGLEAVRHDAAIPKKQEFGWDWGDLITVKINSLQHLPSQVLIAGDANRTLRVLLNTTTRIVSMS